MCYVAIQRGPPSPAALYTRAAAVPGGAIALRRQQCAFTQKNPELGKKRNSLFFSRFSRMTVVSVPTPKWHAVLPIQTANTPQIPRKLSQNSNSCSTCLRPGRKTVAAVAGILRKWVARRRVNEDSYDDVVRNHEQFSKADLIILKLISAFENISNVKPMVSKSLSTRGSGRTTLPSLCHAAGNLEIRIGPFP